MEEANNFKILVLETHLECERNMNRFLIQFISENKSDYDSLLNDTILINLSFRKKISIIEKIFEIGGSRLFSLFYGIEEKNNKIIFLEDIKEVKKLRIKKLIDSLIKINQIRNYLFHNLTLDLTRLDYNHLFPSEIIPDVLKQVKKQPPHVYYKGNE